MAEPPGPPRETVAPITRNEFLAIGVPRCSYSSASSQKAATVQAEVYNSLFPEQRESSDTWYLVDPAGWVMMTYTHDISYKDVITDLKFLLKNSSG